MKNLISEKDRITVLKTIVNEYRLTGAPIANKSKILTDLKIKDLQNTINWLENKRYIKIRFSKNFMTFYAPTSNGDIYFEDLKDEQKQFNFRNIFIPLIISFVTSVLFSILTTILINYFKI